MPAQVTDAQVRRGVVDGHAAQALAGLLGTREQVPDRLPAMWHVAQLLEAVPQCDLGEDGHPRRGVPAPPGPGWRRMFAGGRATHRRLLEIGVEAVRSTGVVSRRHTTGRSGELEFVTVRHTWTQRDRVAIEDEHDIVYRAVTDGAVRPAPRTGGDGATQTAAGPSTTLAVDPVVLFRFSALTYNAHRIHYDRTFARRDGFEDLVVHGPLQVVLLTEHLARRQVDLVGRTLVYRLVAPAVGPQVLTARDGDRDDVDVEVVAGDGTVVATGCTSEEGSQR